MHGQAPHVALLSVLALLVLALVPLPAHAAGDPAARTTRDEAPSVSLPTASIGPFDCTRLTVAVTLDNSRSTEAVTYGYGASFQRPLHPPYRGEDRSTQVHVAAGRTTVLTMPVRDDARSTITVQLPDGGHVFSQGTCGDAPGAVFALTDCDSMRMGLRLDNSSAARATRYRWTERDLAGQVASRVVDVGAGDVVDVEVPLVDGSRVRVDVTVGDAALVATSDWRACGRFAASPRASFGVVECSDVSASVLLDNSRSTARLRFHVPAHADVVLGAGEARTLRLHLPVAERLTVYADEVPADGYPVDLAVVSTTRCAGATVDPSTTPTPTSASPATMAAAATPTTGGDRATAAGDGLAATGSAPLRPVIGLSAALLVAGLGLLAAARRRPRTH